MPSGNAKPPYGPWHVSPGEAIATATDELLRAHVVDDTLDRDALHAPAAGDNHRSDRRRARS